MTKNNEAVQKLASGNKKTGISAVGEARFYMPWYIIIITTK